MSRISRREGKKLDISKVHQLPEAQSFIESLCHQFVDSDGLVDLDEVSQFLAGLQATAQVEPVLSEGEGEMPHENQDKDINDLLEELDVPPAGPGVGSLDVVWKLFDDELSPKERQQIKALESSVEEFLKPLRRGIEPT